MEVIVRLEPLSEQSEPSRFLQNEVHAALLNGFVQDIVSAVSDYLVRGLNAYIYVTDNRSDLSPTKHIREYHVHPRSCKQHPGSHQGHPESRQGH